MTRIGIHGTSCAPTTGGRNDRRRRRWSAGSVISPGQRESRARSRSSARRVRKLPRTTRGRVCIRSRPSRSRWRGRSPRPRRDRASTSRRPQPRRAFTRREFDRGTSRRAPRLVETLSTVHGVRMVRRGAQTDSATTSRRSPWGSPQRLRRRWDRAAAARSSRSATPGSIRATPRIFIRTSQDECWR